MRMVLTVLWRALVAVVGVVVVLAEGRVQQREVQPAFTFPHVPGESRIPARSHSLPSHFNRRSWTHRNIYPGHYSQEKTDTNNNYWTRRARGRYQSSGASTERNLYTERMAPARHESREPQPRRIYTTSTEENAVSRDSWSTARSRTSEGERFNSSVHQVDPSASADNRRRYPHAQGFHEASVQAVARSDQHQRPQPDRRIGNHYRESSIYDNTRENSSSRRQLEGLPHSRQRVHDTHPRLEARADLSMANNATRNLPESFNDPGNQRGVQSTLSEIREEVENDVRQRPDQPDLCCGSRVPLDPRVALATGAFQRVAPAGSIKVVGLPVQHSFPPIEVRDLRAAPIDSNTLSLTWTAPGEDLDSGTASGYIIRLTKEQHDLRESHFDAAPEETLLETSESLAAAGVYVMAGTRVVADVPLGRRLERGQVYYVALKALDNDGHSSGVSNVARFSVPETLTQNNTAPHHQATAEHNVQQDMRLEETLSTNRRGETAQGRRDMTILPERTNTTPPIKTTSRANTAGVEVAEHSGVDSEEQRFLSTPPPLDPEGVEPDEPGQQKKRNGKKNRRRKKNKSKRRRNGRRRDSERQGRGSDTSIEEPEVCEPSEQEQLQSVSLCDARYALTLAIAYFTQNNEHQYLDYLSAALHTIEQKMQPWWRTESRVRRSDGGERSRRATKFTQNV